MDSTWNLIQNSLPSGLWRTSNMAARGERVERHNLSIRQSSSQLVGVSSGSRWVTDTVQVTFRDRRVTVKLPVWLLWIRTHYRDEQWREADVQQSVMGTSCRFSYGPQSVWGVYDGNTHTQAEITDALRARDSLIWHPAGVSLEPLPDVGWMEREREGEVQLQQLDLTLKQPRPTMHCSACWYPMAGHPSVWWTLTKTHLSPPVWKGSVLCYRGSAVSSPLPLCCLFCQMDSPETFSSHRTDYHMLDSEILWFTPSVLLLEGSWRVACFCGLVLWFCCWWSHRGQWHGWIRVIFLFIGSRLLWAHRSCWFLMSHVALSCCGCVESSDSSVLRGQFVMMKTDFSFAAVYCKVKPDPKKPCAARIPWTLCAALCLLISVQNLSFRLWANAAACWDWICIITVRTHQYQSACSHWPRWAWTGVDCLSNLSEVRAGGKTIKQRKRSWRLENKAELWVTHLFPHWNTAALCVGLWKSSAASSC